MSDNLLPTKLCVGSKSEMQRNVYNDCSLKSVVYPVLTLCEFDKSVIVVSFNATQKQLSYFSSVETLRTDSHTISFTSKWNLSISLEWWWNS